jgi:branched-chain amino acid transport system substrate-binding protein
MNHDTPPSLLSRRALLKNMALGGVALALMPVAAQAKGALYPFSFLRSTPMQHVKVGVLLPFSSVYPTMNESFLAGMRLFFDQHGMTPELVTEDIGMGQSMIAAQAQKLINTHRVDVLVGMVNSALAAIANDTPLIQDTPFIAVNQGEMITRNDEYSTWMFNHSLSLWQANYALGTWAAPSLGPRGMMVQSFYESGYDIPHAFRLGVEQSGGTVASTYISHVPPDAGDFAPIAAHITKTQPDFIYAAYSGQQAIDFVRAYAASPFAGQVPLIGSGFLTDERVLAEQGSAALGIKTAFSWSSDLGHAENQTFVAAYRATTGHSPDVFAVLGYDTAQLLGTAVAAVGGDMRRIDELHRALTTARFASPRGQFAMQTNTQSVATMPLYLREVQQRNGTIQNVTVGELESITEGAAQVQEVQASVRSGWVNAYLCI